MQQPFHRNYLVRAIIAGTAGSAIEFYDFVLSASAAILIFPRVFFPHSDPLAGTLISFSTYSAGFISRPIGAAFFGHFGDRLGRKSTLVATLLLMGVSTVLIGLLPTHAQIGAAAPLLLTLLRVVQGLGVGGEWGGAVLLALESGHRGRRGFYASWPQAGVPLGLLTSTGAFALAKWLVPGPAFSAWGWRLPFFLSALLIVVGLLVRLRVLETPLFRQLQESGQVARAPLAEALRRHWREILLAAGSRLSENSCFYLFSAYALSYGKVALGVDELVVLTAVNVAAAVEFFTIPLFGVLSDWTSRKAVFAAGSLFLMAFALPYYALLGTREPAWIVAATVTALAGGHALLYSVQASLIPELFGTRLRYTGASIGYQLAAPVAGGLSPVVAAWLVEKYPGQFWPLAEYVIVISAISLVCVVLLAETSRKDISSAD